MSGQTAPTDADVVGVGLVTFVRIGRGRIYPLVENQLLAAPKAHDAMRCRRVVAMLREFAGRAQEARPKVPETRRSTWSHEVHCASEGN